MLAYNICQYRRSLNVVLMSHNVKIFSYHCSIITTMYVAPSPPLLTTLLPPKFKILGPPRYYQKIFYKFGFATDLVFKFFLFSFSDLFILPLAFM